MDSETSKHSEPSPMQQERAWGPPAGPACAAASRRRRQRFVTWTGALGLGLLPVLGWAGVSLTEFQPGSAIVAADVNSNFSNVNAALDGPVVRAAQRVASWSSSDPSAVPVENAELAIQTSGGLVRVELLADAIGIADEPSRLVIEGPPDQGLRFGCFLERSSDGGATWEQRAWLSLQDSNAQGTAWLSPSIATFVDDASAGEWRYRITAEPDGAATAVAMFNVRMIARELATEP